MTPKDVLRLFTKPSIFDVQSVSCSGQFDIERNFKKANVEGLYSICFKYYKEQSEASGS